MTHISSYDTKNMFSTLYLYDNWQWWLSCEFFVWQPTVTAAKNGQKPPKTDQKPPKIVKNHQTQSTPPKFWTHSIFLWPVLPERKRRRKKLNNLESFKENHFFLDPFTNFFVDLKKRSVGFPSNFLVHPLKKSWLKKSLTLPTKLFFLLIKKMDWKRRRRKKRSPH